MRRTVSLLGMYLVAVYGQGNYIEATYGTEIYFNHRLLENRQINVSEFQARVQDFLIQLAGVKDVYTAHRLMQGAWTPGISRIRGGFNQQRSGDVTIQVMPGWRYVNADTQESKMMREAYVAFPIILYGTGGETGVDYYTRYGGLHCSHAVKSTSHPRSQCLHACTAAIMRIEKFYSRCFSLSQISAALLRARRCFLKYNKVG